ncbi:HPr kinase/phosphorylase, partial [Lactobacillus sp. XV13L]|nr:HPr kinase/phosphorylase [Lactobacillus sp. XV13L]
RGESPQILKHLMEIRGIGIIDVMDLFGVGAVKNRESIKLVIKLVNWDNSANYDRLGFEESKRDICNVEVPQVTIPVKVGRNMEDIIEIAVMNFRAKQIGYNATETFDRNLSKLIAQNSRKDAEKDNDK